MRRLATIAITIFLSASTQAAVLNCHDLEAPVRLGMPAGQVASVIMGQLKNVKAPTHHIAVPEGPLDSVDVLLERTECYGSCPSYSIELKGDGTVSYIGNAFVLVEGRHSSSVSKDSVQCLLEQFKKADFWSLEDQYVADITDGPQYRVTLMIGGQTKTVVDYFGSAVDMPNAVTAIEGEIDRLGADRWVQGTSETLPSLQKEGFDFHSQAAAAMLVRSAATAPDDLIFGLIKAGAPVTGQMSGLTAVERASRYGRTAIVQALIADGAFSIGPPDIKENALISGAASGNSFLVAEILKYRPNVNAQDREGNTALIKLWQSQYCCGDKSKTDIVNVARLLLEAGADPNIANKEGATALFSASNTDVVKMLLKAGAKIDIRDKYGSTPLLDADSDDVAVALIEAGADTNVRPRFGDTIEQRANSMNYTKTLRVLQEKKSKQ